MLYLTTHSTHFYYGFIGIVHVAKNHKDSEAGNLLSPFCGLLFSNDNKGFLYALSHIQNNAYHGAWYTICGANTTGVAIF